MKKCCSGPHCYNHSRFECRVWLRYTWYSYSSLCHPEDTDDETGQVLQGMDSLPGILRHYVREDNRWFQQEVREWKEQFCKDPEEEPTAPPQENAENPEPEPTAEGQNLQENSKCKLLHILWIEDLQRHMVMDTTVCFRGLCVQHLPVKLMGTVIQSLR